MASRQLCLPLRSSPRTAGEYAMDAQRFDSFVRSLRTRRSVIGLAASLGIPLGATFDDAAAKKCKKKCGPCRRCKKGKCKPKPGSLRCGPCSVCQAGKCVAQCSPDNCVEGDEGEICLKECPAACDTCSRCDPVLGQCEPICAVDECIAGFCRVPCEPSCGDCGYCDFGECVDICQNGEACVDGVCDIPCTTACFPDENCIGGDCFPVCEPACGSGQGCVADGAANTCVDFAGNCSSEEHACFAMEFETCSAHNQSGGRCVTLPGGQAFCARGISCGCGSDLDCQSKGFGPNSRCASRCGFCAGSGGFGCIVFAGDA